MLELYKLCRKTQISLTRRIQENDLGLRFGVLDSKWRCASLSVRSEFSVCQELVTTRKVLSTQSQECKYNCWRYYVLRGFGENTPIADVSMSRTIWWDCMMSVCLCKHIWIFVFCVNWWPIRWGICGRVHRASHCGWFRARLHVHQLAWWGLRFNCECFEILYSCWCLNAFYMQRTRTWPCHQGHCRTLSPIYSEDKTNLTTLRSHLIRNRFSYFPDHDP